MSSLTDHNNLETIIEEWDTPIRLHSTDNIYKLLEVITSEYERIDEEVDKLEANRFLQTATGSELEKIGDLVGVNRKKGEKDEKLRKRIQGAFAAHSSDTTYSSFTNVALLILDARPEAVEFKDPPETPPKIVRVQVDDHVIIDNPLTINELTVLLSGSVSIDAIVEIERLGTFAFDDNGASTTTGQETKGWDEGTWSVRQR